MDRYEADWAHGRARLEHARARRGRPVSSRPAEAVETVARREARHRSTRTCPPSSSPARAASRSPPCSDGDAVICFNFRGDRAIEICQARSSDDDFTDFDRGRRPDVFYAGMMEYDGDLHIPATTWSRRPPSSETMGEFLARNQITQLAISETQKYGHVTYFWNGNRSGKFDDQTETYIEIPSDMVPFEQRPWMKAAEITDRLIAELRTGQHRFARVNYANGDMVGHTGSFDATVVAVESRRSAARAGCSRPSTSWTASWSLPPITATPTRCSSTTRTAESFATGARRALW